MGRVFEGDDIDFSREANEAVTRVCHAMEHNLQYYKTEGSLEDFVKSLNAWMTGGCEPVRILIEDAVEAELIVTAINANQTSGLIMTGSIEFSASVHFRTGYSTSVKGLFLHLWRADDIPQGSIHVAPLDDVPYGPSKL